MLRTVTQIAVTSIYLVLAIVFSNAIVEMWFQYEKDTFTPFDTMTGGAFTDNLTLIVVVVYAFANLSALILSFVFVDKLFGHRQTPTERLKQEKQHQL